MRPLLRSTKSMALGRGSENDSTSFLTSWDIEGPLGYGSRVFGCVYMLDRLGVIGTHVKDMLVEGSARENNSKVSLCAHRAPLHRRNANNEPRHGFPAQGTVSMFTSRLEVSSSKI